MCAGVIFAGLHFIKPDLYSPLGKLPGTFAARKPRSEDCDLIHNLFLGLFRCSFLFRRRLLFSGLFILVLALGSGFLLIAALILGHELRAILVYAERLLSAASAGLKQRFAAARAVILCRHIPGHEALDLAAVGSRASPRAVGAALAGVIGVALFRCALQNPAAALGAFAGHFDNYGLCEAALGVSRACEEAAEAAGFHDHLASADIAVFVAQLVGHLDPDAVKRLFGLFKLGAEIAVKLRSSSFQ